MAGTLPADLLRSFVAIAEAGSMSRAARNVFLTQSALSLQMKRLTDIVQTSLFDRHHRGLSLTADGKTLLAYARSILQLNDQALTLLAGGPLHEPARIGMIQDVAEVLLSGVLARFTRLHPDARLQIRVGNSSELLGLLAGGVLDMVVCLAADDDPAAVIRRPMIWLGEAHLCARSPFPLVLMEKPCVFRDAALAALDAHGTPSTIVLESPSISVLRAAVQAGVGITCRTASLLTDAPAATYVAAAALPHVAVALYKAPALPGTVERLAGLIRESILALPQAAGLIAGRV